MESLGRGVLFAATDQGLSAPHRRAGAGLQMAAGHLPLLAESHPLSGGNLRGRLEEKRQSAGRLVRPCGTGQKSL